MQILKLNSRHLLAASLAAVAAQGMAQGDITVLLNGQTVRFDNARPVEVGGRVLIPVRGVLEQLGAQVDWDAPTQTVTATRSNLNVVLRLGSRTAQVNGQNVNLDVPAQYRGGSTMVPLRFMGEALGADVRWNSSSRTVELNTSGGGGDPNIPNPPVNNNPAGISSFSADQSGYARLGTRLRFTLVGTPEGRASFDIPGVAQDVPMRETRPGTYVGEWTVPRSQGMSLTDVTAIAHLVVNGSEKVAETSNTFAIDGQAPRVFGVRPQEDGPVGSNRPIIGARFNDGAGSGIDPQTVMITLDGRDISNDAKVDERQFTYRPTRDLDRGRHDVTLMARDRAGNETTQRWTFQVSGRPNRPRMLTFTEPSDYRQGAAIIATLEADPGATVSLSFGDRRRDIPMRETGPGHYTARYILETDDDFRNQLVRARVKTQDGDTYWVESDRSVANQSIKLVRPTITSHRENDRVDQTLVLKGRAAPYSDIQIHIASSSTLILNQFRIRGVVGDYTVQADARGNWQSPQIDLGRPMGGNVQYTVTTYAIDPAGTKSPVTTLHLTK